MKPIPDCVPDALSMILSTARAVSDDDFIHRKVLLKVMGEIAEEGDLGSDPSDLYLQCWEIACRALGVKDPYENEKARGDKIALGVLKTMTDEYRVVPEETLSFALKTSFAGTMLDYNGLGRSDMQDKLKEFFETPPAVDQSAELIAAIHKAETVMLVANRAGEIALDKPLAEAMANLGKKVYLAVAAKPVFVMATEKDAAAAAFSDRITVVNPGTAMYGLSPERASSEFRDLMSSVDLIIVKGGTHFGTLAPKREMYFILKAVQEEVAAKLGIEPRSGAIVKVAAPEA